MLWEDMPIRHFAKRTLLEIPVLWCVGDQPAPDWEFPGHRTFSSKIGAGVGKPG